MSVTPLSVVVMAKAARPGRVKTRLIRDGLSPEAACGVHEAMLRCVLARVATLLPYASLWLAMDEPHEQETARLFAGDSAHEAWNIIEQGIGDLGKRLERVWLGVERATGSGCVCFLGVDSPDVPYASFDEILQQLRQHDACVGPVADGGYWTLAAARRLPELVRGIDWGTGDVLAQTHQAAQRAGLGLVDLPAWHDVDDAADLHALRERLRLGKNLTPPLLQLRDDLHRLPLSPILSL